MRWKLLQGSESVASQLHLKAYMLEKTHGFDDRLDCLIQEDGVLAMLL